ncbi:hypothetical protein [Paenibacillus tengchongensis]|uniref:hypothetical protein n=1 Tax=Paenibacillus tengchongensis TaxID=2608684 RepID=UPI00124C3C6A|nr:hypothetical protein [Paenibacillus tengchongensis]
MLTFEQKLAVLDSYPELERKNVSLGRVNYHFEESRHDKKTVAYHLHPNGNGFVYAGLLDGYPLDDKGLVNIRDYSEGDLRALLDATISALAAYEPAAPAPSRKKRKAQDSRWTDAEGNVLELKREEDMWYLYAGLNLDMAFETLQEAEEYLAEEGFTRAEP